MGPAKVFCSSHGSLVGWLPSTIISVASSCDGRVMVMIVLVHFEAAQKANWTIPGSFLLNEESSSENRNGMDGKTLKLRRAGLKFVYDNSQSFLRDYENSVEWILTKNTHSPPSVRAHPPPSHSLSSYRPFYLHSAFPMGYEIPEKINLRGKNHSIRISNPPTIQFILQPYKYEWRTRPFKFKRLSGAEGPSVI